MARACGVHWAHQTDCHATGDIGFQGRLIELFSVTHTYSQTVERSYSVKLGCRLCFGFKIHAQRKRQENEGVKDECAVQAEASSECHGSQLCLGQLVRMRDAC